MRESKISNRLDRSGDSARPDFGSDRMKVVERVGSRYLVACECGNYFLSDHHILICDQCGAEHDLDHSKTGPDQQEKP